MRYSSSYKFFYQILKNHETTAFLGLVHDWGIPKIEEHFEEFEKHRESFINPKMIKHPMAWWARESEALGALIDAGMAFPDSDEMHNALLEELLSYPESLKLAHSKGFDIYLKNPLQAPDESRFSPMTSLICRSKKIDLANLETARWLIEQGVDINQGDIEQSTPLMYTAVKNLAEFSKLLIDSGVDIQTRDNNGFTALDYARQSEAFVVIELIQSKQVKKQLENKLPQSDSSLSKKPGVRL